MKKAKPWVRTQTRETGLIEHVCEHGVGHPCAASVDRATRHGFYEAGVHGCDGCCQLPAWREEDQRCR